MGMPGVFSLLLFFLLLLAAYAPSLLLATASSAGAPASLVLHPGAVGVEAD